MRFRARQLAGQNEKSQQISLEASMVSFHLASRARWRARQIGFCNSLSGYQEKGEHRDNHEQECLCKATQATVVA
jgi:hypothetical protein